MRVLVLFQDVTIADMMTTYLTLRRPNLPILRAILKAAMTATGKRTGIVEGVLASCNSMATPTAVTPPYKTQKLNHPNKPLHTTITKSYLSRTTSKVERLPTCAIPSGTAVRLREGAVEVSCSRAQQAGKASIDCIIGICVILYYRIPQHPHCLPYFPLLHS